MASMLGRSAVGLVGRCYDDFVHPEERADVAERRRRMAGNGEAADQVDRRLLHADGSIRWAHVLVTRVREHRGFVTLLAFDDITAEREAKDRLQHAAMHDSLTGLANRRLLEDRLELSLSRSRRTGRLTAVLFLDLDKVKGINDTWGHAVGDQVLTVIADRLRTAVRETDTVARIGGDEFVVVSDGAVDGEEIGDLADRILRDIAQPIALDATTAVVTASIGIATSAGNGTGDEVMRAADMAMYEAKAAGRARISMAPAT
jgi:diguanylate cyclase (GGDEF)-like protein/PAS domain S-box-containing protein